MPRFIAAIVLWACAAAAHAQVTIDVDAAANRRPIDPRIYGLAYADGAALGDLRCPLNRLGGNNTSRYNWQINADNRGFDWFFESVPYGSAAAGEVGDTFIGTAKAAGADAMLTIPTVGWVGKLGSNRSKLASFSAAKYGAQTSCDWQWFPEACNGIASATGQPISGNDPNDASVPADGAFQQGYINHVVGQWGTAASGGLRYYILDNEPSIWHSTHRDVHPTGAGMDEIKAKLVDYGTRVKNADPSAKVVGPEEWGWSGYFWSGYDQWYFAKNGWGVFPDRDAHGGWDYLPWLLDQMRQQQNATGKRVLDVFTVHYYPQGGEFSNDTSQAMQLRRNRSTRSLWDPSYVDETWINDTVRLVPRLGDWVATYYPNTEIGITEYNWGAEGHINGATTQADILGIFGREGLDLAARWTTPAASTPTYKAIRMYRNYDGNGGAFGDVSVSAGGPNPDQVAVFAAERTSDGSLTVMVVNKQLSASTSATIRLAHFAASGPAQAWQLRSTNSITRLADVPVSGGALTATLPPQSITLLVVPAAAGLPTLQIGDVSVLEPASGTAFAVFSVTLSAASGQSVTVDYATANGTASSGADYQAASGTLTIAPGDTSGTVRVTVLADALTESNETFSVGLSGAVGATLADAQGVATIVNSAAVQKLQFSSANYAVSEASASATITVQRVGGTTGAVGVEYVASNGTALAGSDYSLASGTLTFAPGVATRTFVVPIANDALPESNETVLLRLRGPTGAVALASRSTAVLTITDNDPAGAFSFTTAASRVAESTGIATITVRRTGGSIGTATVKYATANGTAVAGADYTAASGVLTFGPAVTTRTFAVTLAKDAVVEGDETLNLALSAATGGAALGTPSTAILTIASADAALQFTTPIFTAVESAANAVITVRRSGPAGGALQVSYATTAGGTATAGVDYTPVSGTLTFATGVVTRTFAVPVLANTVPENAETVKLTLSNLVGGATLGTSSALLTIKDDDAPARLQFAVAETSAAAAGGPTTIKVTRAGVLGSSVNVKYATSNGTAVAGTDYVATSGTLSFAAGVTTQTFTVQVLDDPAASTSKTVNLTLSSPGAGAILSPPSTSKLWIVDGP